MCVSAGVGWGLRAEVGVLVDERTSTPSVFKDLGRCLVLPAALRSLTGVIAATGRRFGGLPSDERDLHPRGPSAQYRVLAIALLAAQVAG